LFASRKSQIASITVNTTAAMRGIKSYFVIDFEIFSKNSLVYSITAEKLSINPLLYLVFNSYVIAQFEISIAI
jgi:hypothetical protein